MMRRAKKFVFLPRWPEPFGRVITEALLSGCEIEGNDRVGALSWGPQVRDPDFCSNSANDFWDTIEAIVGNQLMK
jgi:hypothetical protein